MTEENKEPKIIMVGGEEALDVRGTPVGEEIEAIMREEHGPSAADLGAERPGIDDETFELVKPDTLPSISTKQLDNPFRIDGKRIYSRNIKCPCSSSKKFKKCCWDKLNN